MKRNFLKTTNAALGALMLSAISVAFAASGYNGAVFTTTSTGGGVNENIYAGNMDVYINGGPNNSTANGLPPNEIFYFEVTDPSGKTLLSRDRVVCRQVQTDANGRIVGAYTADGCSHLVGSIDPSDGSQPVRLWPFNRTPNGGNEYKVVLVRKNAPGVSVEADGIHLDYPRSATKTDNFKVLTYTDDGSGGDGGGGTPST